MGVLDGVVGTRRSPDDLPRTIGKYAIVRRIAVGGMGTIYEAKHPTLGHSVAIKVILSKDKAMFERFHLEARATAQLRNPHIATVIDVDALPDGTPYMVMELLGGNDLDVEIEQGGPLPVASAVEYVTQALEGIAGAHAAGIVHRDIKPSNIFLCKPTGVSVRTVVKLLDFGLAKRFTSDHRITAAGDSFGTPQYMSPEQVREVHTLDGRSDLWAFGIVLYEALVGRCPFDGSVTNIIASIIAKQPTPPSKLRPEIPPELDAVIARALEKNRDDRFQTAEEFIYALAAFRPDAPSERQLTPANGLAPTELPPLLGLLLVGLGAVNHGQLRQAVAIQAREPGKRLGDILVAMGACTQAQVRSALEKQKNSLPPGKGAALETGMVPSSLEIRHLPAHRATQRSEYAPTALARVEPSLQPRSVHEKKGRPAGRVLLFLLSPMILTLIGVVAYFLGRRS